ncbi:hypothetical protein IF2G_02503 [Cordyceps javanica]|nr:hypothetical protein IF2G_02503 [Cordyceps javanica]
MLTAQAELGTTHQSRPCRIAVKYLGVLSCRGKACSFYVTELAEVVLVASKRFICNSHLYAASFNYAFSILSSAISVRTYLLLEMHLVAVLQSH